MAAAFEELDYCPTPMGALSLRRRRVPGVDGDVYEVKIGDDFLMSSRFTASETALAEIGLKPLAGDGLDVVVGGLGLGYTAATVLRQARVGSLLVVEAFEAVIGWHRQHLVPLGETLSGDPRCRMVQGDFFALAADPERGFDPDKPGRRFDAILVDIDHSPQDLLSTGHGEFYQPDGLLALSAQLKPDGVFALWSNDPPDADFIANMTLAFADVQAPVVTFDNPLQGRMATATVYVGRRQSD
jgi:spermidine synthase